MSNRKSLQDAVKEIVLLSAIHFDDKREHIHQPVNITTGYVVCGYRHCNCYGLLGAIFTDTDNEPWKRVRPEKETQGFITNKNRFINREEAFKIATDNNQILDPEDTRGNELFSEDIY